MNGFDIYIYKFKKEMKRNMCEQKVVSSYIKMSLSSRNMDMKKVLVKW